MTYTINPNIFTDDLSTLQARLDEAKDSLMSLLRTGQIGDQLVPLASQIWWPSVLIDVAQTAMSDTEREAVHNDLLDMFTRDPNEGPEIYGSSGDYMKYRVSFILNHLRRSARERAAREAILRDHGKVCNRCGGAGYITAFEHVEGGRCFKCGGTGAPPSRD